MSKSTKFFYWSISFIAGIGFGEIARAPMAVAAGFIGALIFLLIVLRKWRLGLSFAVLFLIGVLWSGLNVPEVDKTRIESFNNQRFEFEAVVSAEPQSKSAAQFLTLNPDKYDGLVQIKTDLYPEYDYGDRLFVGCKLLSPEPIAYANYLSVSGVYSVCYDPSLKLISKNKGNFFVAALFKIKQYFIGKINQTISEPQASLLAGILIGARQGIPAELNDSFQKTGVSHIVAISGYNITIIVAMLLNLAAHFYVNRKKTIYFVAIFLVAFVILTGASSSVIRAAIMGGLVLFARQIGRKNNVRNVLTLTAVIMIGLNPKILLYDAGFQLSFLSTVGLVYLSPKLEKYLGWVTEKLSLRENLTSTLSAIIMTMPLILYNFGRLSLVAPIVNILILPAVPISMFVGFIQVAAAIIWKPLGMFVGWWSWLILSYIVKIVEWFAGLPFSAVEFRIGVWVMGLMYGVLIVFVRESQKSKVKSQKSR